jgi:hypothetical protein
MKEEVKDACRKIMGKSLADSMAAKGSWNWVFAAAVAHATKDDDPEALKVLRKRLDEIKGVANG